MSYSNIGSLLTPPPEWVLSLAQQYHRLSTGGGTRLTPRQYYSQKAPAAALQYGKPLSFLAYFYKFEAELRRLASTPVTVQPSTSAPRIRSTGKTSVTVQPSTSAPRIRSTGKTSQPAGGPGQSSIDLAAGAASGMASSYAEHMRKIDETKNALIECGGATAAEAEELAKKGLNAVAYALYMRCQKKQETTTTGEGREISDPSSPVPPSVEPTPFPWTLVIGGAAAAVVVGAIIFIARK